MALYNTLFKPRLLFLSLSSDTFGFSGRDDVLLRFDAFLGLGVLLCVEALLSFFSLFLIKYELEMGPKIITKSPFELFVLDAKESFFDNDR